MKMESWLTLSVGINTTVFSETMEMEHSPKLDIWKMLIDLKMVTSLAVDIDNDGRQDLVMRK